jgi:hypothetical protein
VPEGLEHARPPSLYRSIVSWMYGDLHPVLVIMSFPRCNPSMDADGAFVYYPIVMDEVFNDDWIIMATRNKILRNIEVIRLLYKDGCLNNDVLEMYPWVSPAVSVEFPTEAAS